MSKSEGLTILGALNELKTDILKMQKEQNDENRPMFFIEEGELELKLVAQKSGGAEAKFSLFLFNNKIHGDISKESIQTLKIKFKSIIPNNGTLEQSNSSEQGSVSPEILQNTPSDPAAPTVDTDQDTLPGSKVDPFT